MVEVVWGCEGENVNEIDDKINTTSDKQHKQRCSCATKKSLQFNRLSLPRTNTTFQ